MPSNNAWNGKWSGDHEYYAIVRSFGKRNSILAQEILKKGYFSYAFGDGWVAAISVHAVTLAQAAAARKKSRGFCGYDWMVDSIISDLTIIAPSERKK